MPEAKKPTKDVLLERNYCDAAGNRHKKGDIVPLPADEADDLLDNRIARTAKAD